MLKSMTAYGRAVVVRPFARIVIEIHSVNRKHLEILTSLPSGMARFDADVRKRIAGTILRGHVTVRMQVAFQEGSPISVIPNLQLAKALKEGWDQIASAVGVPSALVDLRLLANRDDLFVVEEQLGDETLWLQAIVEAVDQALGAASLMKVREGEQLAVDISKRLKILDNRMAEIEVRAPEVVQKQRVKLCERLNELVPGLLDNEERLLREVGLYAEKVDITEEITRFKSHLSQCDSLIHGKNASVGKTFEFLIQELNREINTIGSKSNDVDISRNVIDVKSELEKIREQIQNLE